MQVALGCTAAHGLDDARAVALSPDGQVALRRLGDARHRDDVHRRLAQRPAAAAQPQRRLPDLDRSGRLRRRARARGRLGHRGLARRPARLRRRGRRRAPSRASRASRTDRSCSSPASPAASRPRSTPRLRQRAGPGGRRRHRDLARRALRLRRCGIGADAITVFSRDAATGRLTPLAGAAGCLRANRATCAPVSGVDAPVGDRHLAGRRIALRHLDRRHPDVVPARRDDRDAHAAAARIRLSQRRRATTTARRSAGSHAHRPSPSRPTAPPSPRRAPTATPC